MTWEEWINSEYNTDDFALVNNTIHKNALYVCYIEGSDVIENNAEYNMCGGTNPA